MTRGWRRQGSTFLACVALLALLGRTGRCEPEGETTTGEAIAWVEGLPAAFEQAAAGKKVLMICVNAKHAIGEREEPAAKGLREVVYRDPAVVRRSRDFVCVLITAAGTSEDFGELRYRFGIDGNIVSPQHVFARPDHPAGTRPLLRREYWSYGSGEQAVRALLDMMDDALEAHRRLEELPSGPPGAAPGSSRAPEASAERAAWIEEMVELVRGRDRGPRRRALRLLVTYDRKGDCVLALLPLLDELEKASRTGTLVAVVRALAVPGLDEAALALHGLLKHEDIHVRANVAVTLETIGSAASAKPLLASVRREKNASVANHMYRAIGRCGVGNSSARRTLLRGARPGKESDFGSFGAVIGLAYAHGDAKVARDVEKQLLKLGPPSQQGEDDHTFLRALLLWCLSEVGDPESAAFVREKVLDTIEDASSPTTAAFVGFCEAVEQRCAGHGEAQPAVEAAMTAYRSEDGAHALADRARRGRDMRWFVPKGEWGNEPRGDEDD